MPQVIRPDLAAWKTTNEAEGCGEVLWAMCDVDACVYFPCL